jgi:hypothetical protein
VSSRGRVNAKRLPVTIQISAPQPELGCAKQELPCAIDGRKTLAGRPRKELSLCQPSGGDMFGARAIRSQNLLVGSSGKGGGSWIIVDSIACATQEQRSG